ncbi:MAG: hypothetical protein QNJ32_06535 [Xenococcaceae cyanobacterium MO_167.B27]|nr:hypothetical protein [Xenococcaceae cyanobacterium MO_167.B27]
MRKTDNLSLAFAYVHAYEPRDDVNLMGATGSETANEPFGDSATSSDRFCWQFSWRVNDRFE